MLNGGDLRSLCLRNLTQKPAHIILILQNLGFQTKSDKTPGEKLHF